MLFQFGVNHDSMAEQEAIQYALSTTKEEYIATCSVSCEAIWLMMLLTDLFDLEMEATMILCVNQSCIKMMENHVFHDESKHIEIWYHFIRDMMQRGAVKLQYVGTNEQVVDLASVSCKVCTFETSFV
jgi:hypothetical protein